MYVKNFLIISIDLKLINYWYYKKNMCNGIYHKEVFNTTTFLNKYQHNNLLQNAKVKESPIFTCINVFVAAQIGFLHW